MSDWEVQDSDDLRWTCVKSSVSRRTILESDLVLTSMGINTRIERRLFEWRLLTLVPMASQARIQLDLYYNENRPVSRKHEIYPVLGNGFSGVVGYLAVIWIFYILDWLAILGGRHAGALSGLAAQNNEWWLTITALTLHADLTHIVSNSVSGGLFGFVASRYLGNGLAWFLILLCGAVANYLNALIRTEAFYAIGASTAIFAAAGIVCGFTWRKSYIKGASARLNYLPIAGAIFLFVFMGMEGENTDILGHLCGLVVGLIMGIWVGGLNVKLAGKMGQRIFAYASLCLIGLAWLFAV